MRSRNYMVTASVGIKRIKSMLTVILDTAAGLNLLKESCMSRACARHAVTMKRTRLRAAANTQLNDKEVIRLEVQLGRRIADTSFSLVINFAAEMISGTVYINEDIGKISPKKSTLKSAGSGPVAVEESVDSTNYMAKSLESKRSHPED